MTAYTDTQYWSSDALVRRLVEFGDARVAAGGFRGTKKVVPRVFSSLSQAV